MKTPQSSLVAVAGAVASLLLTNAAQAQTCTTTDYTHSETFSSTTFMDPNSASTGWGSGNVKLNYKGGGFPDSPNTKTLGERVYASTSGDYDNDGKSDLVVLTDTPSCHLDFLQGAGNGNFAISSNLGSCSNTSGAVLATGDVDFDGNKDFVFASATAGTLSTTGAIANATLYRNGGVVA
ncbi:MAG TPA: VCBS repeat-containing protein, partial [Myxococcota bacterium]|nr:VCBS repeat-containing protein [Myxococcota bacterium]